MVVARARTRPPRTSKSAVAAATRMRRTMMWACELTFARVEVVLPLHEQTLEVVVGERVQLVAVALKHVGRDVLGQLVFSRHTQQRQSLARTRWRPWLRGEGAQTDQGLHRLAALAAFVVVLLRHLLVLLRLPLERLDIEGAVQVADLLPKLVQLALQNIFFYVCVLVSARVCVGRVASDKHVRRFPAGPPPARADARHAPRPTRRTGGSARRADADCG